MTDNYRYASTEDLPWACAAARGVSYKSLRFDPETGAGAVLIHMCPDTTYPRHRALAGIDLLVIDGDLLVRDTRVTRGCYAHLPAGSEVAPYSADGCVLFAAFPGRVENLHDAPGVYGV